MKLRPPVIEENVCFVLPLLRSELLLQEILDIINIIMIILLAKGKNGWTSLYSRGLHGDDGKTFGRRVLATMQSNKLLSQVGYQ